MNQKENLDIYNISNDLNQEIKNLVLSSIENDITKRRHFEIKVKYLLRKLVDEINITEILSDSFLQIKFAKRYNFYNRDPVSLQNF
jgi:hypothetical protein